MKWVKVVSLKQPKGSSQMKGQGKPKMMKVENSMKDMKMDAKQMAMMKAPKGMPMRGSRAAKAKMKKMK